jgi:hypothetical protein
MMFYIATLVDSSMQHGCATWPARKWRRRPLQAKAIHAAHGHPRSPMADSGRLRRALPLWPARRRMQALRGKQPISLTWQTELCDSAHAKFQLDLLPGEHVFFVLCFCLGPA